MRGSPGTGRAMRRWGPPSGPDRGRTQSGRVNCTKLAWPCFAGYRKPALSYKMWLGLVGARLHHGTIAPRSGPDCAVWPRSGPDCTVGPRSGPDCAVGPRSGPDRAPIAPSGDCAVTLSFALQSYNAASSAKPVAGRSARIRFWEGVVLLGISPELISPRKRGLGEGADSRWSTSFSRFFPPGFLACCLDVGRLVFVFFLPGGFGLFLDVGPFFFWGELLFEGCLGNFRALGANSHEGI